ncbi:hypothetical protein GRH13_004449 [Salmonella enterica subsp. enterica]|nr:hypothetical protein [Salmonella enterica subsp. enterica serovar Chester]EAV3154910.1 hypothetical protein [Salmonella enterica]EBF9867235.1 hypothetical protein [Salmonella enterica subsp. enterica serovar Richmond]EBH3089223.1 hypothetical protein [Salmonella enterica subsp. enterica serovar Poona]EDH6467215.1 hypothetical protein [Salmonella enterica subsp. enterica serovar Newport]
MADRHSIDLPEGSQDLSSAFMHHCMQYGAPWFIKDADGRYLAHSLTLPNLLSSHFASFHFVTDEELNVLTSCYRESISDSEKSAVKSAERIITLHINNFYYLKTLSPLIFITEPFSFNRETVSLTRIVDICSLRNFECMIFEKIINKGTFPDSLLEHPLEFYSEMNPTVILTEDQWLASWLCLMGLSYRDIAKFTKKSHKNTSAQLAKSFTALKIHTLNNFIFISKKYGWEKFIPPAVQHMPTSKTLKRELM